MKTPIAAAVASLLLASMGTLAFAQGAPQPTPPPMNSSTMPGNTMNGMNQNHSNRMSNAQVAQQVMQALQSHGITISNLQVSCDHGTVALGGTVATEKDVHKAKKAAKSVHGVKRVDVSGLHVGPLY